MEKIIAFEKTGYDPFIDFIKAYAIMCVLAGHTMGFLYNMGGGLWLSMQVPLFVLIQVFHIYKKDIYRVSKEKIFWRILFPYIAIQLCLISVFVFCGKMNNIQIIKGLTGGGVWAWLILSMGLYSISNTHSSTSSCF